MVAFKTLVIVKVKVWVLWIDWFRTRDTPVGRTAHLHVWRRAFDSTEGTLLAPSVIREYTILPKLT